MKNKNSTKLRYIFGDEESNENKEKTFKSIILTSSFKSDDNLNYDSIKKTKDILYSFYTTTAGISNALIFLDEKRNIINNLDFYNYNPWKVDWLYSRRYKKERSQMIDKIRKKLDYKGEVSDDEDSIIKYDETQDQLNEQIRLFNRKSIAFEARPNAKNEDRPMISNKEIITGNVDDNDEDSNIEDDDFTYEKLKEFKERKNMMNNRRYFNTEKGKKIINDRIRNSGLPYYNVMLNSKNVKEYNNINDKNNIQNDNNSTVNYMNIHSQNNLMEEGGLFPKQDKINNFKNNK